MKMKISEVIEKIKDINYTIGHVDDADAIEFLEEYRDSILNTTVEVGGY